MEFLLQAIVVLIVMGILLIAIDSCGIGRR